MSKICFVLFKVKGSQLIVNFLTDKKQSRPELRISLIASDKSSMVRTSNAPPY